MSHSAASSLNPPRRLSVLEVCARTQRSPQTIDRWVKAGTFPKLRRPSLWFEAEVDAAIGRAACALSGVEDDALRRATPSIDGQTSLF
jgi:predicted DNA-binding transcriptional regulator AlpA